MDELFSKLKRPFNGSWDAVESDIPVFEQIMIRLPVKSILMLKYVSKHWYNVISTKVFIVLQFCWSMKKPKFLAFYDSSYDDLEDNIVHEMHLMEPNGAYSESYRIPVVETLESLLIVASFNGLICCMNDVTPNEITYDMDLHICNPATREVLVLPRSHVSFDKPIFGVLYSNKSRIYKIFKFFNDQDGTENGYSECEVYSSNTGKWKRLPSAPTHTLMNPTRSLKSNLNHVCVKEKLYWFMSDYREGPMDFPTSILTVDMEENFLEIPLPSDIVDVAFLIEFRGRLCFVEWRVLQFFIWLYNEKNGRWYLLKIVKFPANCSEVAHFDSVAAHKDEILFVYKDVESLRHEILYDVGCATWKDFRIADDAKDKAIVVFPFFETLFPCHSNWSWRPRQW